ncbi:hypothetical protein PINS_up008010 [Pythium insidiosum]|nr:hypothetical protein PINS_up008010 [Pythium insidiosum]
MRWMPQFTDQSMEMEGFFWRDGFNDLLLATDARAVCIGSGRFLRAVLVPVLQRLNCEVVLLQPRGTDFAETCRKDCFNSYDIETIHPNGRIQAEFVQLKAVGSLARQNDRQAFLRLPSRLHDLRFIGLGVTEAGLQPGSAVVAHLAEFLVECWRTIPGNRLSVLNTDNVPSNGDLTKTLVLQAAAQLLPNEMGSFTDYLETSVRFHNTMVDRLTSHAPESIFTPRGEPWPSKTMVIEDCDGFLEDEDFSVFESHVHIRKQRLEFLRDHQLKLRLANATSSALASVMALSRFKTNNEARNVPVVLAFRDKLVELDILPALVSDGVPQADVEGTYAEWSDRSSHPCFGLDNLWVTQDALLRFKARLFSTIRSHVSRDAHHRPSIFMAFVLASICRFLVPRAPVDASTDPPTSVLMGAMDHNSDKTKENEDHGEWEYGGGLRANLPEGTYEFKDGADGRVARALHEAYDRISPDSAPPQLTPSATTIQAVETALQAIEGDVDRLRQQWLSLDAFVADVALLFERLVVAHKRRVPMAALSVLTDLVEPPRG